MTFLSFLSLFAVVFFLTIATVASNTYHRQNLAENILAK